MNVSSLFDQVTIGGRIPVKNRVGMAALTRNRCVDDLKPGPAQARHYGDRARNGAGIIVTEGVMVDWTGSEWEHIPHMIDSSHARGWTQVVDAVHREGSLVYMQAWHAGRCQHDEMPLIKQKNGRVVAPSKIKAEGGKYRLLGGTPGHTDKIEVIKNPTEVVGVYRRAVELAKSAGFDGIEVLAQGGFLPHQFLNPRSNTRTDEYGGSVENRCRFLLRIVEVIADVFGGPEFVIVKIAPADVLNDSVFDRDEMQATYSYLIKQLVALKIGIMTISRRGWDTSPAAPLPRPSGYPLPHDFDPVAEFGPLVKFPGSPTLLMANSEYTADEANGLIASGKIDMVSFGTYFISNPDLLARFRAGHPIAENDGGMHTLYGPCTTVDENYNDWPPAKTDGDGAVPTRG